MHSSQLEDFLQELPAPDSFTGKNLYVWGIGSAANLYQEAFAREPLNIFGYSVNEGYEVSQYTQGGGGHVFGKRLFTPSEVSGDKNAFVLVCTFAPDAYKTISAYLDSLNVKHCHIDAAIFALHKDDLRKVTDLLNDERSRDIYLYLLKRRTQGNFYMEEYTSWDHYFVNPAFQVMDKGDVFVDCGAFVGDTIEEFITQRVGILKKIIALEPDKSSFRALSKRLARLREEWDFSEEAITAYPYAVSDKSSTSYLRRHSEDGTGSSITSEYDGMAEEVRTVAIDDLLTERFTFLKADVQSYEYKMLLGAKQSITKWHPRLGICIYHNASDFYSVPLLVKEIYPDYKLMIRHHSVQIAETVLYAW